MARKRVDSKTKLQVPQTSSDDKEFPLSDEDVATSDTNAKRSTTTLIASFSRTVDPSISWFYQRNPISLL